MNRILNNLYIFYFLATILYFLCWSYFLTLTVCIHLYCFIILYLDHIFKRSLNFIFLFLFYFFLSFFLFVFFMSKVTINKLCLLFLSIWNQSVYNNLIFLLNNFFFILFLFLLLLCEWIYLSFLTISICENYLPNKTTSQSLRRLNLFWIMKKLFRLSFVAWLILDDFRLLFAYINDFWFLHNKVIFKRSWPIF